MNILITGAAGFAGKNLAENLKNIRDGKNKTRPAFHIDSIYEFDVNNTMEELNELGISGLAVSVVADKETIPQRMINRDQCKIPSSNTILVGFDMHGKEPGHNPVQSVFPS